jgi:hypothetical protein
VDITLEFFLYKPNPAAWVWVRKVDLLSISLALKTVILAEPSDQKSVHPFYEFFSPQNTHMFCKKKITRPILRFLTNFEARYIQFEDLI